MNKKLSKHILAKIKKYDNIVIARHVGPDPDAISSQIGLRDTLRLNFPKKDIRAVGMGSYKFNYLGRLDKFEAVEEETLLIIVDVPDKKRIDCPDVDKFTEIIKIDHHPCDEPFCTIEVVDTKATSAAQLILEFIFDSKLEIDDDIAAILFSGIVSDSNRFMFTNNDHRVFTLVGKLLESNELNLAELYEKIYLRPLKEVKFQDYISSNFTVTENGLAYLYISDKVLKKYNVDAAIAGNLINNYNYIDEVLVWVFFSEDVINDNIRCSIRSRGPIINETASLFGGGGHIYASGAKLNTKEEVESLIGALDELLEDYNE